MRLPSHPAGAARPMRANAPDGPDHMNLGKRSTWLTTILRAQNLLSL